MENQPLYSKVYKLNNHGTKQGIIPRFVHQMLDLEEIAFMPIGGLKKSYKYINVAISDFTSFYDLNQEIKIKRNEFYNKLISKEIIETQENGALSIDRTLETNLLENVKAFFIKGRILINNWAKSDVLTDEYFDLKNLLIVNDSNFIKNSNHYLSLDEHRRYEYLLKLIENGRKQFLTRFNNIRARIEHENFQLYYSQIELINDEIKIFEPLLDNTAMYELVDFFYENILNLIEKVMVYYYGINAYLNWNKSMNLFKREEVDFDNQLYEYVIIPNQEIDKMKRLIK
ncbi:MAG: hypothetical protein HXX18_08670 [Bacteroidetes bacterium]|nr:hypothetical protein [Bacteroidota bacterium]